MCSTAKNAEPSFKYEWTLTVNEFSFQALLLVSMLATVNFRVDFAPISVPSGIFKNCNQVTSQPSC